MGRAAPRKAPRIQALAPGIGLATRSSMRIALTFALSALLLGACLDGAREEAAQSEALLPLDCLGHDGGTCRPFPQLAECGEGVHPIDTPVVDTQPPELVAIHDPFLPADDELHRIAPADCVEVRDACSPETHVMFTSVTSDEPIANRPLPYDWQTVDVMSEGCESVLLRGYANPKGNGRVYTIGWRAVDALGHTLAGTCDVHVPTSPESPAIPDGVAYEIDFSNACIPL